MLAMRSSPQRKRDIIPKIENMSMCQNIKWYRANNEGASFPRRKWLVNHILKRQIIMMREIANRMKKFSPVEINLRMTKMSAYVVGGSSKYHFDNYEI